MFKTIKSKFIATLIIFIVIVVGVPIYFLIQQFKENFNQRSEVMLETTIDMLDYGLENAMMIGQNKQVQQIIEKISLNRSIEHIRIFNVEGKILYSTFPDEVGKNVISNSPHHIHLPITKIHERRIDMLKESGVFTAIQPIVNLEKCQGCHGNEKYLGYLDIDTDLTKAEVKFYTGSYHMIFFGGAVIILLFGGMYFLFRKYIDMPLQNFIYALDSVERGNLDVKLSTEKSDEFGKLHHHFNKMVGEIKTGRQKIEEYHLEQLQRADRLVTVGELAAEMAHEINNHSAVVMSRADYLQLASESEPVLKKYEEDLQVIVDQIRKIANITRGILRHSKKLSKKFYEIELAEVAANGLNILRPILEKKKIRIELSNEIQSAKIFGDPGQIEQVIVNLVNNAIDSVKSDGTVKIDITREENKILFCVSDNGIGIPEGIKDHIFSPFFTTKAEEKGTGLGLYIVKNILKNHNAEIECVSEMNKGTTFKIHFDEKVANE
ncbi:MAG: HAMP domain-containing sensor histidine kinase [bacterium]